MFAKKIAQAVHYLLKIKIILTWDDFKQLVSDHEGDMKSPQVE